jgi:hypothetical protein
MTLYSLPPLRTYDHAILLLPNATPVNCKPFSYSPEQKRRLRDKWITCLKMALLFLI